MPDINFRRGLAIVGACFLGANMIALLNFTIYVSGDLAERKPVEYGKVLAQEITGTYALLCLFPAMLWLMTYRRIEAGNWRSRVPLHLLATLVFGACHTLLMWGSRVILFRLAGWGEYNYGQMIYRFPMEYGKQFLMYGFMYAIVSAVLHARRSRTQELRASLLEKKLAEARLETLKMQLNPHFLFNTLNMISSFIYEDPPTAERMIARLSDLLRLTLHSAEGQEIRLEKELQLLDCYLSIMKMRFQEQLQVQLDVQPGTRSCLVPFLILQPLVENSIKHCTAAIHRPGAIRISAAASGDHLRLTVEDEGPGLPADAAEGKNSADGGIGLSNMQKRLEQLYGSGCRLQLSNRADGGLRVTVDLPWRDAGCPGSKFR